MITTREELYTAIFDLLSTAPGFNTYVRRFVPMQQLSSPQLPALMMREWREDRHAGYAQPPKYTIDLDVGIVCETSAELSNSVPATTINALIDAIETVLEPVPSPEYVVQVGIPTVSRLWIEGTIEIIEAIPGSADRSFALIPLKVVCQ